MRRRVLFGSVFRAYGEWEIDIQFNPETVSNKGGSVYISGKASRKLFWSDASITTEDGEITITVSEGLFVDNVLTLPINNSFEEKHIIVTGTIEDVHKEFILIQNGASVETYTDWVLNLTTPNSSNISAAGGQVEFNAIASRELTWTNGETTIETGYPVLSSNIGYFENNILIIPHNSSEESINIEVKANIDGVEKSITLIQNPDEIIDYGDIVLLSADVVDAPASGGRAYSTNSIAKQTLYWASGKTSQGTVNVIEGEINVESKLDIISNRTPVGDVTITAVGSGNKSNTFIVTLYQEANVIESVECLPHEGESTHFKYNDIIPASGGEISPILQGRALATFSSSFTKVFLTNIETDEYSVLFERSYSGASFVNVDTGIFTHPGLGTVVEKERNVYITGILKCTITHSAEFDKKVVQHELSNSTPVYISRNVVVKIEISDSVLTYPLINAEATEAIPEVIEGIFTFTYTSGAKGTNTPGSGTFTKNITFELSGTSNGFVEIDSTNGILTTTNRGVETGPDRRSDAIIMTITAEYKPNSYIGGLSESTTNTVQAYCYQKANYVTDVKLNRGTFLVSYSDVGAEGGEVSPVITGSPSITFTYVTGQSSNTPPPDTVGVGNYNIEYNFSERPRDTFESIDKNTGIVTVSSTGSQVLDRIKSPLIRYQINYTWTSTVDYWSFTQTTNWIMSTTSFYQEANTVIEAVLDLYAVNSSNPPIDMQQENWIAANGGYVELACIMTKTYSSGEVVPTDVTQEADYSSEGVYGTIVGNIFTVESRGTIEGNHRNNTVYAQYEDYSDSIIISQWENKIEELEGDSDFVGGEVVASSTAKLSAGEDARTITISPWSKSSTPVYTSGERGDLVTTQYTGTVKLKSDSNFITFDKTEYTAGVNPVIINITKASHGTTTANEHNVVISITSAISQSYTFVQSANIQTLDSIEAYANYSSNKPSAIPQNDWLNAGGGYIDGKCVANYSYTSGSTNQVDVTSSTTWTSQGNYGSISSNRFTVASRGTTTGNDRYNYIYASFGGKSGSFNTGNYRNERWATGTSGGAYSYGNVSAGTITNATIGAGGGSATAKAGNGSQTWSRTAITTYYEYTSGSTSSAVTTAASSGTNSISPSSSSYTASASSKGTTTSGTTTVGSKEVTWSGSGGKSASGTMYVYQAANSSWYSHVEYSLDSHRFPAANADVGYNGIDLNKITGSRHSVTAYSSGATSKAFLSNYTAIVTDIVGYNGPDYGMAEGTIEYDSGYFDGWSFSWNRNTTGVQRSVTLTIYYYSKSYTDATSPLPLTLYQNG